MADFGMARDISTDGQYIKMTEVKKAIKKFNFLFPFLKFKRTLKVSFVHVLYLKKVDHVKII